ncbi:MAG: PilZ domain-containing protein [Planctomycetaceae bacterium]|nr:PilZ domain-containing protein [Planctomycetaceae bacterium]
MEFEVGSYIHIRKESDSGQSLHPGRVLWSHGNLVAAEMDSRDVPTGDEKVLEVFYEGSDRKFRKQSSRLEGVVGREAADAPSELDLTIMDLEETAPRTVCVFQLDGAATVSENRLCYRVRALSFGIDVECEGGTCRLADISHTGFSLVCEHEIPEGAIIEVTLRSSFSDIQGPVLVRNVHRMRDGRFRYGVVCVDSKTEKGCTRLAMELQRRQLTVKAGAV